MGRACARPEQRRLMRRDDDAESRGCGLRIQFANVVGPAEAVERPLSGRVRGQILDEQWM